MRDRFLAALTQPVDIQPPVARSIFDVMGGYTLAVLILFLSLHLRWWLIGLSASRALVLYTALIVVMLLIWVIKIRISSVRLAAVGALLALVQHWDRFASEVRLWPIWWPLIALLVAVMTTLGVVVYHGYRRPLSRLGRWSGIPRRRKQDGIEPAKTLWDWLTLLGVPLTITLAGIGYSMSTRHADLEVAERFAMDNALKSYLDAMGELLTDKGLSDPEPPEQVRSLARIYTLTAIDRLDEDRKAIVVRFLHESKLISAAHTKVDLHHANLQRANLRSSSLEGINLAALNLNDANLYWVNLREAYLVGAQLQRAFMLLAQLEGANLAAADLTNAHMNRANLQRADLSSAILQGAVLEEANLEEADLSEVRRLTQAQLDSTLTYRDAKNLPAGLTPDPRPWPRDASPASAPESEGER